MAAGTASTAPEIVPGSVGAAVAVAPSGPALALVVGASPTATLTVVGAVTPVGRVALVLTLDVDVLALTLGDEVPPVVGALTCGFDTTDTLGGVGTLTCALAKGATTSDVVKTVARAAVRNS
ncbi:MAG TPA: hypothetical protein VGL99_31275 [Chloroflexota bacterium]|jgi:hypothetical protein